MPLVVSGTHFNVCKYLWGDKEKSDRLFPVVPSDRTRGNGHRLKDRRFSPNIRKHCWTVRLTEPWHTSPRGCRSLPPCRLPKKPSRNGPGKSALGGLTWGGVGPDDLQRSLPTLLWFHEYLLFPILSFILGFNSLTGIFMNASQKNKPPNSQCLWKGIVSYDFILHLISRHNPVYQDFLV